MSDLRPLARELQEVLVRDMPVAFRLLSRRGRRIYFPSRGILGQTAQARGCAVNATIGIALEDDGSPMHYPSLDALVRLPASDVYPYAPSYGKPEFREAWKAHILRKNPSLAAPISLPVVTCGLTHSLSVAGYLFADPGDRILISDLHWDNCGLIFSVSYDAELSPFRTFTATGFDTESFAAALGSGAPGKRIVLLNFPNNPAGYTPTVDEAHRIASAIIAEAERGSDVLVILDDAYFGFVYEDGVLRESLLTLLADLHERVLVVKIDGPTKEDCAWGHRVGCVTFAGKGMTPAAAKALEDKAAGAVRATASCAPHLSQSLLLTLYASPAYAAEHERIRSTLERRYRATKAALSLPACRELFTVLPCNSGYFLCLRLADGMDAEAVRSLLLAEYSTGVIAFAGLIRVAYSSLPEEKIGPCCAAISQACLQVASPSRAAHEQSVAFA